MKFILSIMLLFILLTISYTYYHKSESPASVMQTCDQSTSFISLFRELEAAGSYMSIWVDSSGKVQTAQYSGRFINRLETGALETEVIQQIFQQVRTLSKNLSRPWYPQRDTTLTYESGYSLLQVNDYGTCSRLLFHESNTKIDPFKTLLQVFNPVFTVTTPSKEKVGTLFLYASPMISKGRFPKNDLSNWYSPLVDRWPDLPVRSVDSPEWVQSAAIRAAAAKPGQFIALPEEPDSIDTLKEGLAFYLQVSNEMFLIRTFLFRPIE